MIVYMGDCFMDACCLTVQRGLTRLLYVAPLLFLFLLLPLTSLPLGISMLFYCSSFESFSLKLRTFKHRKRICTYLSSYFTRLHNKLDYVRLSRNLYIHYVCLSRHLHVHYVHFRPTLMLYSIDR